MEFTDALVVASVAKGEVASSGFSAYNRAKRFSPSTFRRTDVGVALAFAVCNETVPRSLPGSAGDNPCRHQSAGISRVTLH